MQKKRPAITEKKGVSLNSLIDKETPLDALLKIDSGKTGTKNKASVVGSGWRYCGISRDEEEFVLAMDRYKHINNRPFPTWSEAFRVLKALGYAKVLGPIQIMKL